MSVVSNPIPVVPESGTTVVMPVRKGRRRGKNRWADPNPLGGNGSITPKIVKADGSTGTMTIDQEVIDKVNAILAEAAKVNDGEEETIEAEAEVVEEPVATPKSSEKTKDASASSKSGGQKASKKAVDARAQTSKSAKEALDAEIEASERLNDEIEKILEDMRDRYKRAGGDPAKLTQSRSSGGEDVPRRATSAGGATTRTSRGDAKMDGREITPEMREKLGPSAQRVVAGTSKVPAPKRAEVLGGLKAFALGMSEAGYSDDEIIAVLKDRLELQRLERGGRQEEEKTKKVDADLRAVL